jgi:hypothetical protein
MESEMMMHRVKEVKVYDGLYRGGDGVKATKDIEINFLDGGTIKIMCFVKEE